MTLLKHRIDEIEGVAEKQEAALAKQLKTAVSTGNSEITESLVSFGENIVSFDKKHSEIAAQTVVSELEKVSPPIVQTIVDSHNALLSRVEMLESQIQQEQAKSQTELVKLLDSSAKTLKKIESKKFPVVSLGGIDKGLGRVSTDLTKAVGIINDRIGKQDAAIKAIQASVSRKRVFDFEFIREDLSDLLEKVVATERT